MIRTTSTITIDCKRNRRPAAVYTQILDELGTFHNPNGKGCDQLPEYIEEELGRERAVAVYFEDSDLMDDVGCIICGIKDAAVNAETPMAAILVSSNDPDGIRDRCRDRLNIVEVEFDRYGHGQLVDILQSRADQAFKTDAVADNMAERIADRVTKLESNPLVAEGVPDSFYNGPDQRRPWSKS